MIRAKSNPSINRYDLASLVRGLYGRVARQLDLDPSYVSRVARGERQSGAIEAALEKEMSRIMKSVRINHNGANHNGANHNAKNHNSRKAKSKAH
jgi:hypothetical protein